MSCPSKLALDDQALNAGETALLQDLEVGHSDLPLYVADIPQTSLVKMLQLLDVPVVGGPRLAAIQKRAQDHSSVYGNLGGQRGLTKVSLSVGRRPHLPFQRAASPQRTGIHCS